MKEYIKPSLDYVALQPEEVFAFGSNALVQANSPDEITTLDLLGLNTSIFVK